MSLNLVKSLARNTSLRLNLWYAAVFSVSAGALFILFYWMLSGVLQDKEREVIEAQLKEYSAVYQAGGAEALQKWIDNSDDTAKHKAFFVRLLSPRRTVVWLNVPEEWSEFNPKVVQLNTLEERIAWNRIPRDDEKDFTIAVSRVSNGSVLQVGRSTNNRETLLKPYRKIFMTVMGSVLLLGIVGGIIFSHRAMHPIRQMVAAAKSIIQTGRLDARVPLRQSHDDLEEMSLLFNHVLDKNQSLIRGMRDSLDNVAHDLRTPMTRLRGIAEMALQQQAENPSDPEPAREALADCVEESDRVLMMLRTLLDVTEAEAGVMNLQCEHVRINSLLDEVLELYRYVAEEKNITLEGKYSPACEAVVDPNRMRQVFANLLDNAIKYTPDGGQVTITAERHGPMLTIRFQDSGMGIAREDVPKIWDRLFRGDRSRSQRGLGLGLSLVKAVVEAHQGEISVESKPDEGSVFTLTLQTDSSVSQ